MDSGICFDMHQLRNMDTTNSTDPAQVIAKQVDNHEVFGAVLDAVVQLLSTTLVLCQKGLVATIIC